MKAPEPDALFKQDQDNKHDAYVAMEAAPRNDGPDDEEDDTHSISPSIVSSVLTADGIHDYSGFLVVCLVILVGDMSRGIMFPSLWPLVKSLGGSRETLGYTVASFSFGRILANPIFGSWSHTMGYSKTLIVSTLIILLGTLLYAQAPLVGRCEYLIFAQTVLGIGSGTLGVTRAFVADVTAKRNRTTYMAWGTAVQYAGFTVTPVFGSLFNRLLGDANYKLMGSSVVQLNMFTAPAYCMTLVLALTLACILTFFQGRNRFTTTKKSKKRLAIDQAANKMTWVGLTVYDCCVLGCMLLNVSTKGNIASFETLGLVIADELFGLEESQAGFTVALCGFLGVIALLNMGHLERNFSDVTIITTGMMIMCVGIGGMSFLQAQENASWKYVLSMFLIYSLGYPIGHTAVIGMFSKSTCCSQSNFQRYMLARSHIPLSPVTVVGRRPQGTLLGWFSSAGSFARVVFPILSGYVSEFSSIQTLCVFLTCALLLSSAFILWAKDTLTLLSS